MGVWRFHKPLANAEIGSIPIPTTKFCYGVLKVTRDLFKGLGDMFEAMFFWMIFGLISAAIFGIIALIGLGWGIWWLCHHLSFIVS